MSSKLDRNLPWILVGLGVLLLIGVIAQVVTSLPPRHFTFLTGRQGGAYYLGAEQYQKAAAEDGFTLNIVPTAGSVDALKMLEEGKGDVAFIQGGIGLQGDPEKVSSLAAVAYEPLWVFYRRALATGEPFDTPLALKGMRVAIGEAGSGTNQLARQILADYDITAENTTFLELPTGEAQAGVDDGSIDAMFLVANYVAPVVGQLLADEKLEMMSLADAPALARRHRFLTELTLPRGTLDLVDVRPREDVTMVSTVANLVVRNNLHPDLLRLLAFTAVDLHGEGGFFAPRNLFPNLDNTDLPVNKEGETYLLRAKNREFTLDRYLPFWISAIFDRYLLFVVPIALILLPLLSRSPLLYQVYMRNKINRWYKDIRRIDQQIDGMTSVLAVDDARRELDEIDRKLVHELTVSNSYMPSLYELRQNVEYVGRRLDQRRALLLGEDGASVAAPAPPALEAADLGAMARPAAPPAPSVN